MGCDGWIIDPNKSNVLIITCYRCSKEIDITNPQDIKKHIGCKRLNDPGIPIQIEWDDNIIDR